MRRLILVYALAVCLFPVGNLRASDRIVLQPPEATTPVTLMGDVADFDAESIEVLMTVGEPIRRYPSHEVLQVETVHTPAHRRGVELIEAGNIDDADRAFEEALGTEPREWVKREILGWRVRCALRRGDRLGAAQQFLRVIESHANPREWPLVPLVWDAEPISEAIRQQGRIWLVGDTHVARLLGASLLLQHPLYASAAQGQLRELSRVSDKTISALARAQLWRLRVTAEDVSDIELSSCEHQIEQMPAQVRAGPYFVLGRMHQHRSDYERALAAFLWLPTVYSENESLTSRACLEAAVSLERQGRVQNAITLLTEITQQHAWSGASGEARASLQRLSQTPAD